MLGKIWTRGVKTTVVLDTADGEEKNATEFLHRTALPAYMGKYQLHGAYIHIQQLCRTTAMLK